MPNNRMKIFDGKLYYGSSSTVTTSSGNVSVGFAGVWDGTVNGWTSLDGGITTGYGRGIYVVDANRIYIFGKFSALGVGNPLTYGSDFGLAEWNGSQWLTVGGSSLGNTNNEVKDVIYDAERQILYAVGKFTTIYGTAANRVAAYHYQTNSWTALQGGVNMDGNSCALDGDGNLYVCGGFTGATNGSFVSGTFGLAKWNRVNGAWESIASGSMSSGWDLTWAEDTNHLYFSGSFSGVNGVANTNKLARYDLTNQVWASIGNFTNGGDNTIYEIDYLGNGKLFIGGYFVSNGNDVAEYDGTTWTGHGIADGFGTIPTVSGLGPIDMVVDGDDNVFLIRNSGGFYIKKNDWTDWYRIDQINSDIPITSRSGGQSIPSYLGTGYLYTHLELIQLGEDNSIPDASSMNIRKLTQTLYDNGHITQEILQSRQTTYYQWMRS